MTDVLLVLAQIAIVAAVVAVIVVVECRIIDGERWPWERAPKGDEQCPRSGWLECRERETQSLLDEHRRDLEREAQLREHEAQFRDREAQRRERDTQRRMDEHRREEERRRQMDEVARKRARAFWAEWEQRQ